MKARYFGVNLNHEFFAYLSEEKKQEIYSDCDAKKSMIFSFEDEENKPVFAAVINIDPDRIHVQEVSGNFGFRMRYCEKLCLIMAEKTGKKIISFCAEREVVKKIGDRLGFYPSKYEGEFEKKVS